MIVVRRGRFPRGFSRARWEHRPVLRDLGEGCGSAERFRRFQGSGYLVPSSGRIGYYRIADIAGWTGGFIGHDTVATRVDGRKYV